VHIGNGGKTHAYSPLSAVVVVRPCKNDVRSFNSFG
jgi:hypothetical protein